MSAFSGTFDITDPDELELSRRCRDYWGKLHTAIVFLDERRVLMTFHPSPDPRWRAWERVRRRWIRSEIAEENEGKAAALREAT